MKCEAQGKCGLCIPGMKKQLKEDGKVNCQQVCDPGYGIKDESYDECSKCVENCKNKLKKFFR